MHKRALSVEELLTHVQWVRALARELVGEGQAEDLAQETLLVGLAKPPHADGPPRRWLAAVMRNLLRDRWRGDERRNTREMTAARPEAAPASDRLLERFEAQRMVAEAVHELAEPYRSALLMRYFEGLPPRTIAARLRLPLRTVTTRLHRALALLRGGLDRRNGDRGSWLAALAPLARADLGVSLGLGVALVKIKAVGIGIASVALLTTSWWLWQGTLRRQLASERGPLAQAEMPAPEVSPAFEPKSRSEIDGANTDRTEIEPLLNVLRVDTGLDPAPMRVLTGRVVDPAGLALAGLRVLATPEEGAQDPTSITTSDAEGYFRFPFAALQGPMRVEEPGYVTLMRAFAYPSDPIWLEPTIVVCPARSLGGRVIDPLGAPWQGAEVYLSFPPLSLGSGQVLDRSEFVSFQRTCDAEGRFAFAQVPALGSITVHASASGAVARTELAEAGQEGLLIVLEHAALPSGVPGVVLNSEGQGVAGASVRVAGYAVSTAGDGSFLLPAAVVEGGREVVATFPGLQPGRTALSSASGALQISPPILVHLGPPPLRLCGRVVDRHGEPLAGIEVSASTRSWVGETDAQGEPVFWNGCELESFSWIDGEEFYPQANTDENGRFCLGGLLPRAYTLALLDRQSLGSMQSAPIQAGTLDVELVFDPESPSRRISGQVVDTAGNALPYAGVRLLRALSLPVEVAPNVLRTRSEQIEAYQMADANGYFDFPAVAEGVQEVRVSRPDDLEYSYDLPATGDALGLEFVAYARAHLHVDGSQSSLGAEEYELLDRQGRPLQIVSYQGNMALGRMRWPVGGATGAALTALDAAATIVFYRGGSEIARQPIHLRPGAVTLIQP